MTKTGKGSFLYSLDGSQSNIANFAPDPTFQNQVLTESLGKSLIKMVYLDS